MPATQAEQTRIDALEARRAQLREMLAEIDDGVTEVEHAVQERDRVELHTPKHDWRPSNAQWNPFTDASGNRVFHTISPEGRAFHVGDGNPPEGQAPAGMLTHVTPSWDEIVAALDEQYLREFRNENVRPTGPVPQRNVVEDHDYYDPDDFEEDDEVCDFCPYV